MLVGSWQFPPSSLCTLLLQTRTIDIVNGIRLEHECLLYLHPLSLLCQVQGSHSDEMATLMLVAIPRGDESK